MGFSRQELRSTGGNCQGDDRQDRAAQLDRLRTADDEAREQLGVCVSISEGTQVPGSEKFCCASPAVSCVACFLLAIPNSAWKGGQLS